MVGAVCGGWCSDVDKLEKRGSVIKKKHRHILAGKGAKKTLGMSLAGKGGDERAQHEERVRRMFPDLVD